MEQRSFFLVENIRFCSVVSTPSMQQVVQLQQQCCIVDAAALPTLMDVLCLLCSITLLEDLICLRQRASEEER